MNANTGWVVGDRGLILKTTNGGNLIGIQQIGNSVPAKYNLSQNYPNPFNPETSIEFDLPQSASTTLLIYDLTGRVVESLVNRQLSRGRYKVTIDGNRLSSGVYFYRLTSGDYFNTKKFVLIK